MEKIIITGTGRCGTTFLMRLFTFLEYDTGFTKNNFQKYIFENCNSGMEKNIDFNHYILKNPVFIDNIEKIINENYNIKYVIIPIRDYNLSAQSRVKHSKNAGGLWNANNEKKQLEFYYKIMSNYLLNMVKYEINTIFLDFDKMINNKEYLYNKLKNIMDEKNINFELFSKIYEEVSLIS